MKKSFDYSYLTNSVSNLYYGTNGRKCAIGILIPEEAYNPEVEGKSIIAILQRDFSDNNIADKLLAMLTASLGYLSNSDLEFLSELQLIHDTCSPHLWESKLRIFARSYDLNYGD